MRRFVIFYLHWSGSDAAAALYLEIKAWAAEGKSGRKGVRGCTEPWEMSRHSASLLLSLTSPTFHRHSQFAGRAAPRWQEMKPPQLLQHTPSPQCRPSLPHSSLFCSRHHHLTHPAHQRPGRNTVGLAWSLLFSPFSHFVANLDSLLLQCPDSLRQICLWKVERDGRWQWWKFRHFSAYSGISVLSSFSPPHVKPLANPPAVTAACE